MSVFLLLDSAQHFFTKTISEHYLQMQTEWESSTVHNGSFIFTLRIQKKSQVKIHSPAQ